MCCYMTRCVCAWCILEYILLIWGNTSRRTNTPYNRIHCIFELNGIYLSLSLSIYLFIIRFISVRNMNNICCCCSSPATIFDTAILLFHSYTYTDTAFKQHSLRLNYCQRNVYIGHTHIHTHTLLYK